MSCFPRLLSCCLLLASCCVAPLLSAAEPAYPDDPFAADREPWTATETGSARGQTRLTALGAVIDGRNSADPFLGGQLGVEFLLHEYGGIRINGFQELLSTDGTSMRHHFSSVRAGPALHLRPYRKVDFGIYGEGGLLIVDLADGRTSGRAPEITLGGFISVHVDSFVFMQMELERAWSNVEIGGVFAREHRSAAKLGIGVAF